MEYKIETRELDSPRGCKFAVRYRENLHEGWSTTPHRFQSREKAEAYVDKQGDCTRLTQWGKDSGWTVYRDQDESLRCNILLTKVDLQQMHGDRLAQLKEAGMLIEEAFAEPETPTPAGVLERTLLRILDS